MNRSYNHIKRLVDTNDEVHSNLKTWSRRPCLKFKQGGNYDANQLDGKQRHTRFNYYEYDVLKFGTPGRAQWAQRLLDGGSLNFQEHFEDLEHDQARHQGIHDHGYSQTC